MAHQTPGDAAGYRRDDANPPYLYPDYVATRLRAPKKPLIILPRDPLGHDRAGLSDVSR